MLQQFSLCFSKITNVLTDVILRRTSPPKMRRYSLRFSKLKENGDFSVRHTNLHYRWISVEFMIIFGHHDNVLNDKVKCYAVARTLRTFGGNFFEGKPKAKLYTFLTRTVTVTL